MNKSEDNSCNTEPTSDENKPTLSNRDTLMNEYKDLLINQEEEQELIENQCEYIMPSPYKIGSPYKEDVFTIETVSNNNNNKNHT